MTMARRYRTTMRNVVAPQPDQIADSEFAIDSEIERGKVPLPAGELQPDPDSPNLAQFQEWFLSDEFALVPSRTGGAQCESKI